MYFTPRLHSLVASLLGICLLISLLTACGRQSPDASLQEQRRLALDSVASRIHSSDSLRMLLQTYQAQRDLLGQVIAHRHLGTFYRNNSAFNRAQDYYLSGLRLAEQVPDTQEMILAYNNLGTNYRRLSMLDMACDNHTEALRLSMSYSDTTSYQARKSRVMSLNGLGNVYLSLNNNAQADSVLRLALMGEQRLGSPLGLAINYANLGSIYEQAGQHDSAFAYYRQSMRYNREAGSSLGIALCHVHFGKLYEQEYDYDRSTREYREGYRLLMASNDQWHALEAIIALARVKQEQKKDAEALAWLDKAFAIATDISSIDHLYEISRLYFDYYRKHGHAAQAFKYHELVEAYRDSVFNIQRLNEIQNARVRFERQTKDREISLIRQNYNLERKAKNTAYITLLISLLLAFLLVGILLYVLYLRIRTQRVMRDLQRTREHFFTNITHEFRTPLTVILGIADMMRKYDTEQANAASLTKFHEAGAMIERQGGSLLHLINQLLDIAKTRSAIGKADWRTGNVIPLLSMIVEGFYPLARQRAVRLVFHPSEKETVMDFVPDYIIKILRNLISNALKFTPEGGEVTVGSARRDNRLVLTGCDTGRGISKEALEHIFEPFYQAADDTGNIGTGLGLNLISQMAKAMNGTVEATSELGKGSLFTVVLPLRHGRHLWKQFSLSELSGLPTMLSDETAPASQPQDEDSHHTARVLVIEDNTDVASYIGGILRARYDVSFASEGETGIEKARRLIPDLIITDLMMPGMDGLELCRRIRQSELLNHIPVIMVTAQATPEDRIRGIEAGADGYLFKPFMPEELEIRVEKLLEQRRRLREKYAAALSRGEQVTEGWTPAEHAMIAEVDRYVGENLATGTTDVDTLASRLCMSESQLRRKFYAITGQTPAAYMLHLRLTRVRKLLVAEPEQSIGDLAASCGFFDNANFSRVFKQVFGLTPSQARKEDLAKQEG